MIYLSVMCLVVSFAATSGNGAMGVMSVMSVMSVVCGVMICHLIQLSLRPVHNDTTTSLFSRFCYRSGKVSISIDPFLSYKRV